MMNRLFFFACLLLSYPLSAQWGGAETHTLTDDEKVELSTDQSLMTDPNNNLHVLYLREREDSVGYDVFYDRRNPEGAWNGATQINNDNTPVWDAALAAIETDSFHVAWIGNGELSKELFVTTFRGVTKIERQVTNNDTEEFDPCTFVDKEGYLHVAWAGFDNDSVPKIFYANNAFQDTLIAQKLSFSSPGEYVDRCRPSLAITEGGAAHLIFKSNLNDQRLQYIFNQGLNNQLWSTNFVPSDNVADHYGYLSVGPEGRLHMAFSGQANEGDPQKIHYTSKPPNNSPNWDALDLVDEDQLGNLMSLDVDSSGFAHIAINEVQDSVAQGNLLYANNYGDVWNVIELIEDEQTFNGRILFDNVDQAYALCARTNDTVPGSELIIYGNPMSLYTEPEVEDTMEVVDTMDTAIEYNELIQWSVSPNPSSDFIDILFPLGSQQNKWTLYDANGRLVKSGLCSNCQSNQVNIKELPKGVFLLQVLSDNIRLSEKIMVGL